MKMRIVRRPREFTFLCLLAALSTPIFLLNLWVMQKGSLAKVIEPEKRVWMAVQLGWMLVTVYWLLRGRWRGFISILAMTVFLLGANLFFLVTMKNYALAFYALFILILSAMYSVNLMRCLRETYYQSGKHWYEGRPKFLPRIEAEIRSDGQVVPVRLSRLGEEGCYAFPQFGTKIEKVEGIALKLGDLHLDCAVELISYSKDRSGNGLRFVAESADERKDIKDFIDRLRSAGYVA